MSEPVSHSETRGTRWAVVWLIASIACLGILGPKLLWMNDDYAAMVRSWPLDVRLMIHPMLRMLLVLVGWVLVLRLKPAAEPMTMGVMIAPGRVLMGIAVGLGCTLPMLLLGLMSDSFTPSRIEIMHTALSPGLTEEIFYRAFMFGLLVQVARTPMWTTAVITGVVFGLAHVDLTPAEGETIIGQLGPWIGMIALGGFMYAWLYSKSHWNLWVVIALHTGMNLWWDMFALNDTPLGVWGATAARVLCVLLALYLVVGRGVLGGADGARMAHERRPTIA